MGKLKVRKYLIQDIYSKRELYFTPQEMQRAVARVRQKKLKIAKEMKKRSGFEMKGLKKRSVLELENVLKYQRELDRNRAKGRKLRL